MKPFLIRKTYGQLEQYSRDILEEHLTELPDGQHTVGIEQVKRGGYFHPTRYKYYFDCVLGLALPIMSGYYLFVDQNAEARNPDTVEELHYCLKIEKNPVKIISTVNGKVRVVGQTTTKMSDREFIGDYLEDIVSDFSGPPYFAYSDTGCPTYEEWKEHHKTKTWKQFKESFVAA